jgi:glycerol-3-phosphate acyltransferase PlsX
MIKIALDIMGGDNAPQSNIDGAIDFLTKNQGLVKIYMIGDEKIILSELAKNTKISNN